MAILPLRGFGCKMPMPSDAAEFAVAYLQAKRHWQNGRLSSGDGSHPAVSRLVLWAKPPETENQRVKKSDDYHANTGAVHRRVHIT